MIRLLLALLLLTLTSSVQAGTHSERLANELLAKINRHRAIEGKQPLQMQPSLVRAAELHSAEMADVGYFSHTSPDPRRATLRARVEAEGVSPRVVSENIYRGQGHTEELVVEACVSSWLESASHRLNILDSESAFTGIGVAVAGDIYYITQVFASEDIGVTVDSLSSAEPSISSEDVAQELFALTNQHRVKGGLPPLAHREGLAEAAYLHSEEMLNIGYFGHSSPVPERRGLRQRVVLSGLNPHRLAENIYTCKGYPPETVAREAMEALMASPGHRRNILHPKTRRMGIGVCVSQGEYYITQVFSGDE